MQRFSTRGLFAIVILAFSLASLTLAAMIPKSREAIRRWILRDQRQILAKTSGYATPEGPFVSIFKIREGNALIIEVYTSPGEDGSPNLLQKIPLDETRDGYFNFMGNATNLVLSDTDNDGAMDILAPSFDDQMTARLNVFRFNRSINMFERVIPPGPQEGP